MNNNNEKSENTVVNVQKVIISITNKNTVIFCRVSSYGQTGKFSISFEVQEHQGKICANLFNLKVMATYKVVESAYDGKSCTIKSLISKNKGKNMIVYNVSRFCRNIDRGLELLDYALKCNTRLFFVDEGIVWDKNHTHFRQKLRDRLYLAEEESKAIGKRVKAALAEKKRLGYFTGGTPKYGFKVVSDFGGKRAVPKLDEQDVIKFINLCRTVKTSVRTLNEWMRKISPSFDSPIELCFNNKTVKTIKEPLTYTDIAALLNSYGVDRRGSKWTRSSVSEIARRDYENVLEGLVAMDIE